MRLLGRQTQEHPRQPHYYLNVDGGFENPRPVRARHPACALGMGLAVVIGAKWSAAVILERHFERVNTP